MFSVIVLVPGVYFTYMHIHTIFCDCKALHFFLVEQIHIRLGSTINPILFTLFFNNRLSFNWMGGMSKLNKKDLKEKCVLCASRIDRHTASSEKDHKAIVCKFCLKLCRSILKRQSRHHHHYNCYMSVLVFATSTRACINGASAGNINYAPRLKL